MGRRSCRRRTSPALGPLDDDDLLAEILVRLPPMPSSLPLASLVCKRWRSIATDAAFHRRFRTHHRKPPILGFFERYATGVIFMTLLDPPDCIPSERFSVMNLSCHKYFAWKVLGCRHGRVLLVNSCARRFLVFEPVSGDIHHILAPMEFPNGVTNVTTTVICAAGDHVPGECHSIPFKLVLVGNRKQQQAAIALVYSSETEVWADLVSTTEPCTGGISRLSCTLVGNALYWSLIGSAVGILQFDLDSQSLSVIDGPLDAPVDSQIQIIRAKDGGLGLVIVSYPSIQLWDSKVDCHGVARWVPRKTVNMDKVLGRNADSAHIVGYAEDADAIFLLKSEAPDNDPSRHLLVIVHLESMKVEKHRGSFHKEDFHPFTNVYTTGAVRVGSTPSAIEPVKQ